MKARAQPGRTRMTQAAELAQRDKRVANAIDALVRHLKDKKNVPEPRLSDFSGEGQDFKEEEMFAIFALAFKRARQGDFSFEQFAKKMDLTRPVLARPRMTNKALDFWRMLCQQEIVEELWPRWNARTGRRGRDPGFLAKALLIMVAVLGKSPFFDVNYEELTGEPARPDPYDRARSVGNRRPTRFEVVFEWIEQKAAAAVGKRPQSFGFKRYEKACEQVSLIVDQARNPGALASDACVSVNVRLLKWLAVTYPDMGRRLAIDSVYVKGWVKQVGKRDAEEENRIRKLAPNASPRSFKDKFLGRGYWLFVLTDLATNCPVCWGLWPGGDSNYEAAALYHVLNDLFERWPECPTTHIVADRAWDNKQAIRYCAVHFGIHLIVGRDDEPKSAEDSDGDDNPGNERPSAGKKPKPMGLDRFDYPDVGSYDRLGNVYCRHCGALMRRAGIDFVNRGRREKLGLKPGDAAPESMFRLRLECPTDRCPGVKKAQLHMRVDWAALSAYPHTCQGGRDDLHAERLALYARRYSGLEGLFGSLKVGHKLALNGAARTHTPNESTLETLLCLCLLFRTLLIVAHERIQQGAPALPPPDLLADIDAAR